MSNSEGAARILATLDLMEQGYEVMKQNITRKNPGASEEVILRLTQAWIDKKASTIVIPADDEEQLAKYAALRVEMQKSGM